MSRLILLLKLVPTILHHGLIMQVQRPLNPEKLSPRLLARLLNVEPSKLEGYRWERFIRELLRVGVCICLLWIAYILQNKSPDFATRFLVRCFSWGLMN